MDGFLLCDVRFPRVTGHTKPFMSSTFRIQLSGKEAFSCALRADNPETFALKVFCEIVTPDADSKCAFELSRACEVASGKSFAVLNRSRTPELFNWKFLLRGQDFLLAFEPAAPNF